MKVKTFKTRNHLGVVEYQQMVDVDGLIEITRMMLADDPMNAGAALIVSWADSLGRTPTNTEFEAFIAKLGIRLIPAEKIDYEN